MTLILWIYVHHAVVMIDGSVYHTETTEQYQQPQHHCNQQLHADTTINILYHLIYKYKHS